VAASVHLKKKSETSGGEVRDKTPTTRRNASPDAMCPGGPLLPELELGDLDLDHLDELLDCGDDLMDIE
jgi:hypothetical protein